MSKKNHPNIHAVQLSCDVIKSIRNNLRGNAKGRPLTISILDEDIIDFITTVSIKLDDKYGVK